MAWIEVHQELRKHPKIAKLASLAGVSRAEATGYILNLWLWCVAYCRNGDLTEFTAEEMQEACDAASPDVMKWLVKSSWVDEKNSKKLVHDWKKHGMKLLEANRERVRKHRRQKELEEKEENYGNVTVMPTIPNLTLPDLTLPKDGEEMYVAAGSLWNNFAEKNGLSKVIKLGPERRAHVRQRVSEPEFDLAAIFAKIEGSDFLRGAKGDWRVDFDFVFGSKNGYVKILEGKYDGRTKGRSSPNTGNSKGDQASRATNAITEKDLQSATELENKLTDSLRARGECP